MPISDLEHRTREIGREIFSRVSDYEHSASTAQWLDDQMMALSMRDEALKVQLFRFVDALPLLKSPEQVNRHLREYLSQAGQRMPKLIRQAIPLIPEKGFTGGLLARAARFNATRLARRFIAGTTVNETLDTIEELRRQGMAFTVDLLGEAVLSESEADAYQREYLHFISGLTDRAQAWGQIPQIDRSALGTIPRVNVSVKLSSLYSQFDPIAPGQTSRAVCTRLRPILRLAKARGAFVNIDMEQFSYKDVTLRIFEEIFSEDEFRDWEDVGIAIQAYLRSCGDDLRRLVRFVERRGTPVWVRLVKGAYWDYETVIAQQQNWPSPVFARKWETDANYERQTQFMIEHHDLLRPALGSHNVRSIAHALALVEHHSIAPRLIEFQMLYGMADPIKSALVSMGQRVRVYTPFGQLLPGMAYLVRRLLENTSNQSFLRAGFLEHVAVEKLLMNPAETPTVNASGNGKSRQGLDRSTGFQPVTGFRNEPLMDFSISTNRDAFSAALRQVHASFPIQATLVSAGRPIESTESIESINPARPSEVVGRSARATKEQAQSAIAAAKRAFPAWRDATAEHRADILQRTAEVLRRRRIELAALEVFECGKPWREADADIAEAIDFCEFYAREALRIEAEGRNVPGEENLQIYEGLGVAVVIAPWNFPLAILCGMTVAALVAGNSVIMKPAEQSPIIAHELMKALEEAGLPPGVCNYLPGIGEEIGPVLVNHPDVVLIAFTGSRAVGLSIQENAARTPPGQHHIKRVITELGGKNAIIVDEDADLDEAVHSVMASAFGYAGQKCSACSRAIVLGGVYDAFVSRLVEATRSLSVGPPEDPGNFLGPVIDDDAFKRIHDYIATGEGEGRLVYPTSDPASRDAGAGYFIRPHIFADVEPDARIAQEEIFGPVLAVIRARDLDHALQIANGTPYALTGGLHSRSPANIDRIRREFRVGNLYINRKITGALVDRQPFGGHKLSGTGPKAGGRDYLTQFMVARTITENTLRHGFAPIEDATAGTTGGVGE